MLAVALTLIAYFVVMIGLGLAAQRRTHDATDFYLGGRGLGSWVAALSASASSSSAWTLLGVSGAAFSWGRPALWLFPATVLGFVINWIWIAPGLRRLGRTTDAVTLPGLLFADLPDGAARLNRRLSAAMIVFAFSFYVASQLQGAGGAFSSALGIDTRLAIVIGAAVVLIYTSLGGFWAASLTDTFQGLMMAAVSIGLPVALLARVGGLEGLDLTAAEGAPPTAGLAGVGFIAGTLGIGLGYPGQPHVVNRFMALSSETALKRGRIVAIGWAVVVYAGMLVTGLAARSLVPHLADGETAMFAAAHQVLGPLLAAVVTAAVLSAVMSTTDSQLLVCASSVTHDWMGGAASDRIGGVRVTFVAIAIVATGLALFAPAAIFERVLFAWHALGSAFGPLVVSRIAGWRVRPAAVTAAMLVGFLGTVALDQIADAPAWAERLGPLVAALAIVVTGRRRT